MVYRHEEVRPVTKHATRTHILNTNLEIVPKPLLSASQKRSYIRFQYRPLNRDRTETCSIGLSKEIVHKVSVSASQ